MQATFDKLQQLQEVLSEKYRIEHNLEEIPKQLITKKEVVSRLKRGKAEKEEQAAVFRAKASDLRTKLADTQHVREEAEKRMGAIKTQREFEALEKEINSAAIEEEILRKEAQKEEKALEEIDRAVALDNELILAQEAELEEASKKIEEESAGERRVLQDLKEKEASLTPGMDSELLYKFESIIRNKSGLGIVGVKGGICQGCHIVLPSQFVNQVRAAQAIKFCPYCSRILFYEEGGEEFYQGFFDNDDLGGLADLMDEDDIEEEEEPSLIDEEMAGDYEDN